MLAGASKPPPAARKPVGQCPAARHRAKAARVAVDEAKEIARKDDKAFAAGRGVRRAKNKLQGDR